MKPQIVTKGIVLSRTEYGEADRILTVLTPDQGKLRIIAKGVRRPKSKLAGGIELFSINDITVLPSQRELKTLISSRLLTNFGNIIKDIKRTMLGYDVLKIINRNTEDEPEEAYFTLLRQALEGLDDLDLPLEMVELWFTVQLLFINGHAPNLRTDTAGKTLEADQTYLFDFDEMAFKQQKGAPYTSRHIKLLRVAYAANGPSVIRQITDAAQYAGEVLNLAKNILKQNS